MSEEEREREGEREGRTGEREGRQERRGGSFGVNNKGRYLEGQ